MSSSLSAARRGYRYQDLISALVLAKSIRSGNQEAVSLDWPLRINDRFDDIDVRSDRMRLRRQVKFSSTENPVLDVAAVTTTARNLRIDHLIESARSDSCFAEATYVVTTPFEIADDLRPFLSAVHAGDGFLSETVWRLEIENIWPAGKDPSWKPLEHVSRDDLQAFASRFFIEVAPTASLDLDSPGKLEVALFQILVDDIGVGTYPNHDRIVSDVAAVLVDFAATVRVNSGTTGPDDALRRLGLRMDYGRVAQQFPVVREALVERIALLNALAESARSKKFVRVIGPPGAGKSWLLTGTAELLERHGAIVARHYCYLAPGDEHVEERITTQTLFGNVIAEIVDTAPEFRDAARPLFGSGSRQLEQVLRAIEERDPTRHVVLIIDGLDHIGRVLGSAMSVAAEDATIVSELASLSLPDNTHVIVASQPGPHIAPLIDISEELLLPQWNEGDMLLLAERLGVTEALRTEALLDDRAVQEATSLLVSKAEGNPLYATFLCHTILQRLRDDGGLPGEALRDLPPLQGDIATYYAWLLPGTADVPRLVAETLAFVEFGVTPDDLAAILPIALPYISDALRRLRPVLRRVTLQGGIRLYHESFRRYVVETALGGAAAARRILTPVVTWLTSAGFYVDNRSYRFLLPLLVRSGRSEEALSYLSSSFIEKSIAAAQSSAAMSANLLLGVNLALDGDDWPVFIRIVELDRARATFERRMPPALVRAYARAFVLREGARALADRLLFDGRTTMDRDTGLLICALVDEYGEVPPWREYLALGDDDNEREDLSVSEAAFRGWMRRNPTDAAQALLRWLEKSADLDERVDHALSLIAHATAVAGPTSLIEAKHLTGRAGAVLRLGVAFVLADRGDETAAGALINPLSPGDVPLALLDRFGALSEKLEEAFVVAADIHNVRAVLPDGNRFQTRETNEWVAAVRLAARVRPAELINVRAAISDKGWAHAWLRFVIDLAAAEACSDPDARDSAVVLALQQLRATPEHPNPFSIYGAEKAMHASFARALHLVTSARFAEVVASIESLSRETHSHFQGSAMGPLVAEEFVAVLAPYVADAACRDIALAAMTRRVVAAVQYGEFYETHAEHHLLLASAFASSGQTAEADTHWQQAATYLAAYGFRRDVTLFEPLAALKSLAPLAAGATQHRVARLQPLAENVDDHTDGKDTKWVYHRWFDALLTADPHGAIDLITEAVRPNVGAMDWRVEDAYDDVAERVATLDVHPVLAAYLQTTIRGKGSADAVEPRAAVLRRLLPGYPEEHHLVTVLAAATGGEAASIDSAAAATVASLAAEFHVLVPALRVSAQSSAATAGSEPKRRYAPREILPNTPRDLAIAFHRTAFGFRDDAKYSSEYADTLGFRLLPLEDAPALQLLRTFARAAHFSGGDSVLELVGDGFAWRERRALAAAAYALAFVYARPEWSIFGHRDSCHLFTNARQLEPGVANEILRTEAKHLFAEYGGNYGFTQHTVELFAALGEAETAFAIFDASLEVVSNRLPLEAPGYHPFPRYAPRIRKTQSLDEGIAALVLARTEHPEVHRRRAALSGVAAAIQYGVTEIADPVGRAIEAGQTLARMALLDILELLGEKATWCIDRIREPLRVCANEPLFGIQGTARELLARLGEAVPAPEAPTSTHAGPLSDHEVRRLLDTDDRARTIAHHVPEFGPAFASVLDAAAHDEDRKARIRAKSERFYDSANGRFPDHFVYDHQAIVEDALHTITSVTVAPDTDEASAALDVLRPKMEHYIAHWHSRAPRPHTLPLPHDHISGVSAPAQIEDEAYSGWYRIGYYESELLLTEYGRKITGDVLAISGVQLHPGESANRKAFFVSGTRRQRGFPICLAGMHDMNGPLGRIRILLPALEMIEQFDLTTGFWTEPIVASDVIGPAIVYRQWRENPLGSDMVEETPTLVGCDLLLRPDLFRAVYQAAAGWVSNVAFVEHRQEDSPADHA